MWLEARQVVSRRVLVDLCFGFDKWVRTHCLQRVRHGNKRILKETTRTHVQEGIIWHNDVYQKEQKKNHHTP